MMQDLCLQLISSVDPKFLKLTKLDDKIYSLFRETFKDLDIKQLKEGDLKSDKAKEVRLKMGVNMFFDSEMEFCCLFLA